ncbi:hypothetical protein T12_517 [Trichinella patagoniensis]|uniref:Apple domain-containing protein n=1 Tax=Trichinella patagoniensis TaxID=990121 RepID=A0A0V0ZJY6_9BILA|nr:hypothetical protein T12_517 [Trichinella patagoniensis]
MDAVLKQHMFFNKVQLNKENGCFLNAVLKQHIFFIVIFITNFVLNLALQFVSSIDTRAIPLNILVLQSSASYISEMQHTILYQKMMRQDSQDIFYCTAVTKLNCTAALYWQYTNSNKMHVILKIAAVSVGKIIHTTSMDTAITANIHLPSIHRVCVVQKRPFVESYGIQRLQQITTSSLRRCLAACDAPTYSSCNSVLFSVQEETCILLARPQAFRFLGGTAATVETAAQFFINLICRNDFTGRPSYKLQSFARQPVIVYAASNLHMQIGILHELFYGSKAAIRLLLWDSADEKECLKICIASITTDYCDAYYFSSRENTCLTMRMKKQYASPMNHGHLIVTKFYDDETLDKAFRDENEEHLMYPDHFTEMKVSLHEFREICVTQHWISTLIPNITFSRHYENIIFFHECINICRHLKNSEECKGIAYSKKMKTCMIAVDGNEHGEILLNNDQQYVTLSSCKKDRETERANNIQHVFCFIPELDEMCLLELYEPLDLSGWKIITRIENTFSFQECLLKCASVMNVQKCSAVNFIDQQCVLLGRARRASFLRSRHSVFAELLYCELKRKRETERKGNAPVNTSSSPNSDGRTNNLVLWTRLLEGAAPLMMMNESKFDMKTLSSFFVIKAQMQSDIKALMLQQLYRISFGFTNPMHSYVYIPLLDREYPIASRIPIFMYDSFESCIAACSTYSTREQLCNAFMYSDITKACHLHFYTLHLTAGMCPVETGQSQFYLHHGCFNKSFFARLTAYMTETSLKKCLSRCIVKGAEACNSVIFSLQEKSCTLVTHQSTFSALTKTLQSSAYFFEIDHCKTKVVKNPLLLQILSQNPTIPIQSISGYRIQHIPITESENATIIDLIDCTNMQCCLQCCILKKVALGCNAIFFNAEEKTCLLMKLNVNSSKTAELVLYNLYTDTDGKEKLILSNYEDTLRFKTSFVSLHEFHERCQIATFTSAYAENLKVHPIMLKANTLNGCLNACRSNRSDIFNCSGVLYSKHEETCYQLVEGTSHDQIVTLNGQTIVLLQRCVKDREEERRNNIVFFHYYFYELEEKCVFEFYDSKNFSGFVVYDNIPRANAFYQCVLKCASEQISKGCAAVLKSQQICLFFKRNSTARIFRKLSSSYFAELLYCESHYINSNVTVNHKIEVETKSEMPHQNKTCAIKNAVLKQHILFTLTNCNLMSVYVPKLDATCALLVKKINDFEAYKIERLFCSFESCIAICFQHRYPCNSFKYTPFAKQCDLYIRNATYHSLPEDVETGQSRHLLLHSCHKEISTVPVGKITETTSLDTDAMTASIHLPSIHRVCVVRKRPFVESYGIQRLDQITTSSLRRCLAACDAPTYSSCNSVLFSVQEETCILLERPQAFFYLGGTSPTVDSAAQFFIFVYCYNVGTSYAMQGFGRQPVIAYAVSNLHMQVDIHHELFYGSKAAIRLGLLDSADEKECLKKCIASIEAGYCDAYYFSSKENTCLTMQLKKQYTLPERLGHRSVTKFYDDVTLDITFRDESEECIMFPDHFTETEVSLHEFREICVTKHWISSLIPNIIFSKRYVNISFINECINICRHLKNSEECKGIAYSKKMKTCMIAVGGNEHGEILLSNDQQYVTLSSCKKDRETERANNEQHVLGFIPELDETCLLELYEPLDLSGWKIITRIENTFSLQECLLKCASVMNVQKCSAVNFIDQQCVLFSRAKRASFVRSVYSVFAELLYCE